MRGKSVALALVGLPLLAGLGGMSGCSFAPPVSVPESRALASVCRELQKGFSARLRGFPRSVEEVEELRPTDLLVFLTDARRPPISGMDQATLAALRGFVARGGRMLLLGFATNLVHEMGVEPRAPDRYAIYRWGISNATAVGTYVFGFTRERDKMDSLLSGLAPSPTGAGVDETGGWLLGGGELVQVQSCHWEGADPQRGMVLGRLFRERDGEPRQLDTAVLTYWRVGKGGILAYGNLPEPWRKAPAIAANARQFLRNAVRGLFRGAPERVFVCVESGAAPTDSMLRPLPRLSQRSMPGASLLPHWGWQVALSYQQESPEPMTPAGLRNVVLNDSYAAGADLIDLQFGELQRGYPFAWTDNDPLPRPESYLGGAFWQNWNVNAVRELVLDAHVHGMLVHAYLDPGLTPGGTPGEALLAMRWFARELLDVRRLGDTALDGVGLRAWFRDDDAICARVFAQYHPAFHGYYTGLHPSRIPGFTRAVHADHGSPKGIFAAGISRGWRTDAFPPEEYPIGVLDCRSRSAPRPRFTGRHGDGGGSYGDWIVVQANDFVRARIGIGAGLWWKAFNPRMMAPQTVAYVHGISMLPIKAAVAGRLSATGAGGYRDLVSKFAPTVQSGFGAQSPLPAETPYLQNNFVRVHGTGGPVQFDPTGRALFDPRALGKTPRPFLRSKWVGIRFGLDSPDTRPIDFISGSNRGPEGYGPVVVIAAEERATETFPEQLAYDNPGRWPRRAEVTFHVDKAIYELQLSLVGVVGRGIVELRREGELLRVFAFREGEALQRYTVPMPFARSGERSLSLEVIDGGSVAVRTCRLEHGGSVMLAKTLPTETRVLEYAGPLAQLEETSGSRFINERRLLTTIADLPGFLLSIQYDFVKSVQSVEREIHLTGYRRVVAWASRRRDRMKGPIILAADDPSHPELMIVPLQNWRYDYFRIDERGRLFLVCHPRTKYRIDVGFLLLRDLGRGDAAVARQIFADVISPVTLQLEANSRVELPPTITSVPYPRVVRIIHDRSTAFRVREGRYWYHRGSQPTRDAGVWLHVYHVDDQPIIIEAFDPTSSVVVHPGPGALHSLVLENPRDHSVTAHLRTVGPLLSAPSVVFPSPFNAVKLNGRPWSYFDGSRVFLPCWPGSYRIEVGTEVSRSPRLLRTGGRVRACAYDGSTGELVVRFADRVAEQVADTAWVSGAPSEVIGGEIIEAHEFGYRSPEQRQAMTNGVVIRVLSKELRVRYDARYQ